MNTWNVARKELGKLRDPKMIIYLTVTPLVLTLLLGTALSNAFQPSVSVGDIRVLYRIDALDEPLISYWNAFAAEGERAGIRFEAADSDEDARAAVVRRQAVGYAVLSEEGLSYLGNGGSPVENGIAQSYLSSFAERYKLAEEIAAAGGNGEQAAAVLTAPAASDYVRETAPNAARKPDYLPENERTRAAASVLPLGIAALAGAQLHPPLLLLVPAHLYEAAALLPAARARTGGMPPPAVPGPVAAPAAPKPASPASALPPPPASALPPPPVPIALLLASAAVIPRPELALYLFVGVLTVLFYAAVGRFQDKLRHLQAERDRLRETAERLRSRLADNAAVLRQTEYTTKLEERNRMSQKVHDTVGHAMTGALIQMEAAKRLLRTDPDKSEELLGNAIRISKDGIDRIRADLAAVKPAAEHLGIHRLKLFLEEFSAKHPIRTVLTHEGNLDAITPIHWNIIRENVREALTNTLKYGQATQASVRIQVLPTLIKAEVADNGRGEAKIIKGMGIVGMEERAAEVNGKVIVDGSRGFTVTTLLPYPL